MLQPETADEMTRRQRDEPRVFVHLARHVFRANDAEAARVEQAHLDAFGGQRHPRINVRRIIVVVNEDVVAPAEFQAGGDEAQAQRGRADERDFVRLAVQQLRAEFARVVEAVHHEGFLVAERGLLRAGGNRVGHAARQRADAGVREKNFFARDGEFVPAQFLAGKDFGQRHPARIVCPGPAGKAELKTVRDVGDLVEIAGVEPDDVVGDDQHDAKINKARASIARRPGACSCLRRCNSGAGGAASRRAGR